jgi:pyruvate/2-oxoglutarate/acetoin dehydrogenase E1 component
VNRVLSETLRAHPETVVFGENIDKGSCLCGVARGLPGRVVNVGNCENTHVGAGFGLMLSGMDAVLIMKQLDFLLLALDPLVNTWNLIRAARSADALGSFTIVAIVCDQGWQGPQSSFNGLADICSLARVEGYTVNTLAEIETVVRRNLVKPGFRLIGLSQRMFGRGAGPREAIAMSDDLGVFQYSEGSDATVVALNFSSDSAVAVEKRMHERMLRPGVFSAHPGPDRDWQLIYSHAARTGRLLIVDDAKGANSFANRLAVETLRQSPRCLVIVKTRETSVDFGVGGDEFPFDAACAVEEMFA